MILKALYDYYHRSGNLAPAGFELKEISFAIVVDENGKFCGIEDLRADAKTPKKILVPKGFRSGDVAKPYLMWDNVEYTLGYTPNRAQLQVETDKVKLSKLEKSVSKVERNHGVLKQEYIDFASKYPDSKELNAVAKFYESEQLQNVFNDVNWALIKKKPTVNITYS